MDGMTLLQRAVRSGLQVTRDGVRIRIDGPKSQESLAQALIARKSEVLHALEVSTLPPCWRAEYEERAAIMEYDGGQSRARAEANALRDILRQMFVVPTVAYLSENIRNAT